ncbi:MAG: RNA polymerase-binding protein DksA [Serpentinimonas sp.]|nr:RNA polymerase-binding protein DksA [Serpentinimonas sp.]
MKESAPTAEAVDAAAAAPAKRPVKTGSKAAAKPDAQAAPDEVLKVGSEVRLPSVNKRATQAAMQAQMSQAVEPSHDPGAAKAVFSPSPERVLVAITPMSPKKNLKLSSNWKTVPLDQLTDADVQAMPDAEYMNEVPLAFFRRKLQQLKRDILVKAGETTEHLREDTSVVPDPADRATIEEEHALELRTRDRERKLLKKIEQSIARIDSGDYGYCDETGEPIGVGRLLARPTASLSIEAQQRRELKQKLFGD